MSHRGAKANEKVLQTGVSITQLAKRLGINRQTVYNWFKNEDLSKDNLMRIGKIIKYDFSQDFPGLFDEELILQEPPTQYRNVNSLQTELTQVLTKYAQALEKTVVLREENADLREQLARLGNTPEKPDSKE